MRKVLKVTLYVVCSILLVLLLALLWLNSEWGQNVVRGKAEAYLKKKTGTEVKIGFLGVGFPKYVVVREILLKDLGHDTLLAVGELKVDLAMMDLLNKHANVQQLVLNGVHGHVYRNLGDTEFNYGYLIAAFAGKGPDTTTTTKVKDTSKAPFRLTIGTVRLSDIHVRYDDYMGGVQMAVDLAQLNLRMKVTDIANQRFEVRELKIKGLQGSFVADTSYLPTLPKEEGMPPKLVLAADDVRLEDVGFEYGDKQSDLWFGVNVGELQLQLDRFGLREQQIAVKKLAITNTDARLRMGKNKKTTKTNADTTVADEATAAWRILADFVDLSDVSYQMDNDNEVKLTKGMDYAHMYLKDVALSMRDVQYCTDSITGDVRHLAAKEQCGLVVEELKTKFVYNAHGAVLDGLYLQTPGTLLQQRAAVHYESLGGLKEHPEELQLDINLTESRVAMSEVLLLVPQLAEQGQMKKMANMQLRLDAVVNGKLGDMNIERLYVGGVGSSAVDVSGNIIGLPEVKDIKYNLLIAGVQTGAKDIAMFVPDTMLDAVRIPDRLRITGTVSGTAEDYVANLFLTSTDGMAHIEGGLLLSPGKGKERYDMRVGVAHLNLGRILRQDSLMGAVTSNFVMKGTGFDLKHMVATVDGKVTEAQLMGYKYHDVALYAHVAQQRANVDLMSTDTNVQMQVKVKLDFGGEYPSLLADVLIDSVNMKAIKVSEMPLKLSLMLHADIPVLNPDYPKGRVIIWDPVINANGKHYHMDSMLLVSAPGADGSQHIMADLGLLTASVDGKMPLTKIGMAVQEHTNRHYFLQNKDSLTNEKGLRDSETLPMAYNLKASLVVKDKPVLRGLLPGLAEFEDVHATASLTNEQMKATVQLPNIVYGSTIIDGGVVHVQEEDSAINWKVTVAKVAQGDISLWGTNIAGTIKENSITAALSITDEAGKERFALSGYMSSVADSQIIHLNEGLKLDYAPWEVAQPNRVVLSRGGLYVNNFRVSNNGQYIAAVSKGNYINAPLRVDLGHFRLSNLTKAISKSDTLIADGVVNGQVDMEEMSPRMKVTGDVTVAGMTVLGDALGDLQITVSNKKENELAANARLKGLGNDIALNGSYYLKPSDGNDYDMAIKVNALALKSVEHLSGNQIRNSSGYVRGLLHAKGTVTAPIITGSLRTDNIATTVSQLNAVFKLPAEEVSFEQGQIKFKDFTIQDDNKNKANVNGAVDISDLANMNIDLRLNAKNWQALHSTEKENKTFYGDLLLTADIHVKGALMAPRVDGELKILKGTNVTVVNPESNPEIESRKGIVVFRDMRDTGRKNPLPSTTKGKTIESTNKASADVNVNIAIDKTAEFSLIIDKSSGDYLNFKGEANINASLTPDGAINLAGNYALTEGAYQLNYNLVKRKFGIKAGSMITFAGDPVKGTMIDLTAVYATNVAPYDLVQRQVTDAAQLNYYKQRLPFDVNMYMKGAILSPRLTFDIQLPEGKTNKLTSEQTGIVQGKLIQMRTDTSELNKQVFALLILNRFVSDDPFSSGAGSNPSFVALQSVSTFLGEQLNKAAGKLVKGVDFSVDLATTEDYTTGSLRQRTDLNLAASKQLLNDRLKLTLGNNFEIEGAQNNTTQSSYVPSNLAADYMLSSDGKYIMRAYRKAYDVGVLQGYVTETGLNFIMSLDYNKFSRELKSKKRRERERQEKRATKK